MKIKTAVICAAGLGSRLGLDMPKCLVEIGQHRLVYYLLQLLEDFEDVRIVVGFKENEVMEYVKRIRKDVIFVRNPDYQTTTNAYSLYLGSKDLKEPYLTIDGDMIVDKDSFKKFITACKEGENLIGLTRAKTDDAVFVRMEEGNMVTEFSREKISDLEWSGISYFSNIQVSKDGNYVYQELESHLPIRGEMIECYEIDTPSDLAKAYNEIDFLAGYN